MKNEREELIVVQRIVIFRDVERIKKFVSEAEKMDFNIDIKSGRYYVDAKSILGLLSMDLSRQQTVYFNCSKQEADEFLKKVDSFIYIAD